MQTDHRKRSGVPLQHTLPHSLMPEFPDETGAWPEPIHLRILLCSANMGLEACVNTPNIILLRFSWLCSKWPYLLSNLLSPIYLFSSKGKRLEQKRRLWKAARSHGKASHDRQVHTKLEGVNERREWKEWRSVLCLNVAPARPTISNHSMQIPGALP